MSPKPWAKTEIDFINHPKFRALNANAICLWLEGKNYCDKNMTDGLIPLHVVDQFRFRGKKSVAALLASCGPKNETNTYSALWEPHAIGYKMHDYLDYNDCREIVVARLDLADEKRDKENERLRHWRAAKKAKAEETAREQVLKRVSNVTGNADETLYTETATATETPVGKEHQQGGDTRPRPMAPIHDTSHRKHAVCGRVCLHASLFNDFVRRRNHGDADREIRKWAEGVVDEWTTGAFERVEPGDMFDFWKARYAERWPADKAAAPSRLPAWAQR